MALRNKTLFANTAPKQLASTIIATAASLALAGCNALPASGPTEMQIVHGAAGSENQFGFKIVDLNAAPIGAFTTPPPPEFAGLDPGDPTGRNLGRIGPGDVLTISVFEIGNGLFAQPSTAPDLEGPVAGPQAAVSTTTLPNIQVDAEGYITVPYAAPILAAGETPQQLGARVQAALSGQSQNPQVIVNVTGNLNNTVIISGDVKQPGRIPLVPTPERLLDVIAVAGGPADPEQDIYVSLTRNGRTMGAPLSALADDEQHDVYISPGDRVHLAFQPPSFSVFGAADKVQQLDFPVSHVTLADALALSGGPANAQADPNAVFLFRFETPAVARQLGAPVTGSSVPVIYHLDMMQPASYFIAQKFPMRDQDLIYIANAGSDKVSKFFNLVGSLLAPAVITANAVR
jgi:polysaccharide export outer membrane protein